MKLWRKPLDQDRVMIPHGEVHIIIERCKGCELCVTYCPCDVLEMSRIFNAKGYSLPQVDGSKDCVICGLCEMICPEFAIYIEEVSHG
ncbi:MAG: 4Fe-4S ferredoxin [Anaerolineaceae bacterium 4572_78]|nr:MAG: 4Fe-4S ferredoxin [Anaerolineaceae bacterium 4572_78]